MANAPGKPSLRSWPPGLRWEGRLRGAATVSELRELLRELRDSGELRRLASAAEGGTGGGPQEAVAAAAAAAGPAGPAAAAAAAEEEEGEEEEEEEEGGRTSGLPQVCINAAVNGGPSRQWYLMCCSSSAQAERGRALARAWRSMHCPGGRAAKWDAAELGQ